MAHLITDPPPALPARDPRGHKGTFGTVAVVGGCAAAPMGSSAAAPGAGADAMMIGGPCFAAMAALRVGAGLARLVMPAPVLASALTIAPSATGVALAVDDRGRVVPHEAARTLDGVLAGADCLAVGPGLGLGDGPRALTLRAIAQEEAPVVIDADALNNLASTPDAHRDFRAAAILTPHPGEWRALAAALGVEGDPVSPDSRPEACERLAQRLGCVVVLKGANTCVSDGHRTWVDDSPPNPALATAGTGDVLTGAIAGLVAQFHRRPLGAGARAVKSEQRGGLSLFDCARLGVRLHAIAGRLWADLWERPAGLLATDLIDQLPAAMAEWGGSQE